MIPAVSRRLLIVAYAYPPMPSVGSNRWYAMARHLRALGHDVTVLSTSAFGRMGDGEQEQHVRRAADLTASPLVRRVLRRGPLPPTSEAAGASATPPASPLPPFLQRIFVPDLYIATWVPRAIPLARRIVRERAIECVVTTSPYESVHLVGAAVRRLGPAWVADFRDGWCYEPYRLPFPTAAQRAADRWMEARVARGADRLIAATRAIAEDFGTRLGVEAAHVANGFDPLRHPELPQVGFDGLPADAIVLLHTGKLAGLRGRDPRPLFEAIRRLADEDPQLGARLHLVLAGRLDSDDARLVAESGLGEKLVDLGQRSHAESIALQRRADLLVLLTSIGKDVVTGKLNEYLSAGQPILVLGDETEAARIVEETSTGLAVGRSDVAAIAEVLRRLGQGALREAYAPRGLAPYVYPAPAEAVAELIEEAIAGRRGSGR